ncbi:TPA: hypothetical protein U2Q93_004663 [Enterobacter sichuanensis]|nr:hypothetical protein [Enterobacter sichuanensis]HEM8746909.1 hypothetical protein [Enterobacter sichuanensis]
MKINFTPETYQALIARANRENKAAAALVSELITIVLNKEETNESKKKSNNLR